MIDDRITLRLGTLAEAVIAAAKAAEQSPSEWLREAAAEKLGVAAPEMSAGSGANAETASRANAARWKPKTKKRRRSS